MTEHSQSYVIGASPDCAIRIAQTDVSAQHARLSWSGGAWVLEDLQSTNGTFVNGQRIGVARVDRESRVALGSHDTTLDKLLGSVAPQRPSPTGPGTSPRGGPPEPVGPVEEYPVESRMLIIGRDERCDIQIAEARVSGRHARVFRNAGRLVLEDSGSANGTFVNGERIAWKILTADDIVQVGSRQMRFLRSARPPIEAQPARIDVRNVTVDVVDRETKQPLRIVDDISFTALPGELVALMGPSGSGKTTLLMALAGLGRPTFGSVELNGRSLYAASGEFAGGFSSLVGYAPQDDIVHDLLTVEEAVRYSAELRCPPSVSSSEIARRVTRALQDVGLEQKRRTRIGSPTSKSLSGGQRKRVNIAMELVTDPPVLLLDEPTSGLSSKDAADLVDLLRRLTDGGRTIVLTLHQPSYPMFVQIDQLVLLEQGRLAYFGPTAIDSFDFFQVKDRQAGALLDEIPVEGLPVWPYRFRESDNFRRSVVARQELPVDPAHFTAPPATRGPISALFTLLRRGLLLKARDRYFWIVAVAVPLVVATLFAVVLGAQLGADECPTTEEHARAGVEHGYLLVLTIMACFFGALSSSLEILRERAVLARERRSGLGLLPYLCSKAFLFVIPAFTHPFCSLAVLHLVGGALEGSFVRHFAVLVPGFFAAACAGLCISASVGSAEGVIGLAVSYAIVQTVFSVFAPLSVTVGKNASHEYLRWAAAPVTARWTLSGLVTQSDICRPAAEEGQPEERSKSTDEAAQKPKITDLNPDVPSLGETTPRAASPVGSRAPLLPELPSPPPMVGQPPNVPAPGQVPPGCKPKDHCSNDVCLRNDLFRERCQKNYYLDHGVVDAETEADRTDPWHFVSSVFVNSFLAFAALVGAGVLLRRK
jgi:ABC-type multidrug transport system ATPase subunit/pSer/pThr/pTyr-binding forkhead associated (FHA) protein